MIGVPCAPHRPICKFRGFMVVRVKGICPYCLREYDHLWYIGELALWLKCPYCKQDVLLRDIGEILK